MVMMVTMAMMVMEPVQINYAHATCVANSLRPDDTLVQVGGMGHGLMHVMACCLLGTKPLSKQRPTYGQLDSQEQTSLKFESKYEKFHSTTWILKMLFMKWGSLNVLIDCQQKLGHEIIAQSKPCDRTIVGGNLAITPGT